MSSHRTIEGYEDEAPVNRQAHSEKTKLFFLVMHSHFTGLPPVFATQLILSEGEGLFGRDMPFRSVEPLSGTMMGEMTEYDNQVPQS